MSQQNGSGQNEGPGALQALLNNLSPKNALIVGLVGGVMALCTIGFVIFVTLMVRGNLLYNKVANTAGSVVANNPTPVVNQPSSDQLTGAVPPISNQDYIKGNVNAKVAMVIYTDFECPFCKRFHPTVQRLITEYQNKVKFVIRHYPLSFHANAQKEAEAAECIGEQGGSKAFYAYADKVFERTASNGYGLALTALAPLAKELGLDSAKFQVCLDSGKYASKVAKQEQDGAAAGVQGTPGSFIIGKDGKAQLVSGAVPYEQAKAALDAVLQ